MKKSVTRQFLIASLIIFLSAVQAEESIEKSTEEGESFRVSPEMIWSQPNQEHKFLIEGGLPPIRWQSQSGEIVKSEEEEHIFLYRAPKMYMLDSVRFYDRAGQEFEVKINVLRPLKISPSLRNVRIDGRTDFIIQGGSGQYEISDDGGFDVKILLEEFPHLEVTVGKSIGEKTISIRDSITQEQAEATLNVYGPLGSHKVE